MEQSSIDLVIDEAMNLIKSASSTRNVKLRDVALAIVESAGGGTLKTHFS